MNLKYYTFTFLLLIIVFSCDSMGDAAVGDQLTAEVNGVDWNFADVEVSRTPDALVISGTGYLQEDEATAPMNFQMKIVGFPVEEEVETPYEASFAPNTQEVAAIATLVPEDRPVMFDTQLNPNTGGTLVITDMDGSTISGEFSFIAADQEGRTLEVTNGRFNNIPY